MTNEPEISRVVRSANCRQICCDNEALFSPVAVVCNTATAATELGPTYSNQRPKALHTGSRQHDDMIMIGWHC